MTQDPSSSRFKAEMPAIPGVPSGAGRPARANPLLPLIAGVVVFGLLLLLAVRWLGKSRPVEPAHPEAAPQLEVPPAPPDPSTLLPHASQTNPIIADVNDLSKPWSVAYFYIRDFTTTEDVPAAIVRLPSSAPSTPAGYWAFSRKSLYGNCELEYISDLDKLRTEYQYRAAAHPLVGNPCTHTLYDPLKTANLPGNVWIRGAIVQGGDIRPPLGIEIKVQGKQILAIRTE